MYIEKEGRVKSFSLGETVGLTRFHSFEFIKSQRRLEQRSNHTKIKQDAHCETRCRQPYPNTDLILICWLIEFMGLIWLAINCGVVYFLSLGKIGIEFIGL